MKISIDYKTIARNKKIAQLTLYLSLALLVLGFFWSIRNTDPEKTLIGWAILIPSYFLVQLSIYMANKWGKSPRPDEIVVQSIKGLNDEFTLYNFTTPVPHLLIGPQGIWIINPYHHKGEISYDVNRMSYTQKGGAGFIGKYFGQEGLPKISRETRALKKDLRDYIVKRDIKVKTEPEVVNLFYSDEVELISKDFPDICVKADKFKAMIRKEAKKRILTLEDLSEINQQLPQSE